MDKWLVIPGSDRDALVCVGRDAEDKLTMTTTAVGRREVIVPLAERLNASAASV